MTLEQQIVGVTEWLLIAIIGWWTLGATLWVIALRGSHPLVDRLATTVSLPGGRRFAQAFLALGLTALPACSPDQPPPSLVYLGEVSPTPAPSTSTSTSTSTIPTPRPTMAPEVTTSTPETTIAADGGPTEQGPITATPLQHEVVPGDHLWGIATQVIAARQTTGADQTPDSAEIARYWRRLITSNAATIRSGDPNLIYPGEILTLPLSA